MTPKVEQVLHPIIMLLFSFTTVVLHSLLSIQMLIIGRYLRFPMRTIDIIMRRKERKKTRLNQLNKNLSRKTTEQGVSKTKLLSLFGSKSLSRQVCLL